MKSSFQSIPNGFKKIQESKNRQNVMHIMFAMICLFMYGTKASAQFEQAKALYCDERIEKLQRYIHPESDRPYRGTRLLPAVG